MLMLLTIFYLAATTLLASATTTTTTTTTIPFPSISRASATYDWCDCSTGVTTITVWPLSNTNKSQAVTITKGPPLWIQWNEPVSEVGWSCGGTTADQKSTLPTSLTTWSIQLSSEKKGLGCNNKMTGRLHFANFNKKKGHSVVYSSGENGYACIKIPVLLSLQPSGRLLAFAEARMITCSDFAWTDLVVKHSDDAGRTWSNLRVVRTESNATSVPTVIGNAAPVQLRSSGRNSDQSSAQNSAQNSDQNSDPNSDQKSGRILLPHTRNNTDVWMMHSDDNGVTWSIPRCLGDNVTRSTWKWVGTGPPGSLELQSGRILVPSYHSKVRGNLINNIVHGHVMLSDDGGVTFRLGRQENGFGHGTKLVNENQAVQLTNGSILINGRSFATLTTPKRLQTISNDNGETFGVVTYVNELKQPFNGCQGSIVGPTKEKEALYFTGPDSVFKRDHLTLFTSIDSGNSWQNILLVDKGASGYSSLQLTLNGTVLGLLYEQSDEDV